MTSTSVACCQVEILEIEERKNNHINELMKKHEKAFGEIKNYYNDITHNNLDLIRSLKEEARLARNTDAASCLSPRFERLACLACR